MPRPKKRVAKKRKPLLKRRRPTRFRPRRRFKPQLKLRLRAAGEVPKVVPEKEEQPLKTAPATTPKASAKRHLLLCPGPVNLSPHVRAALASQEICHREPEFSNLLQTVRAKLLRALEVDGHYTVAILTGSGTCALEAAVLACVDSGRKLLVVNNGVYGSRIAQIARFHGLPLTEIRSPITERPDLNRLAAALKRDSDIGTVAMVHHETSTGMLNPVEAVAALAKKHRRRFLVDGISSLGAERLDLRKHHVGLCVGSSGKCLHGPPGLSFVLLSQEEAARMVRAKPRSLYLDLGTLLKAQEAGETPFTPAVPLFFAFHAALDELLKEGVRMRAARYRQRASFLRSGFKKLGLKGLLDEKLLSNTLTALWVPKGIAYPQLHDRLKRAGFVVYAGQSELKGKIFRIAHMGQLLQSDLTGLLKALKETLIPVPP